MKNKYIKGFLPIIILLIIVVVGAVTFLAYTNFNLKIPNFATPTVTPSSVLFPSSDPNPNWKTLSLNDSSFAYPEDYLTQPAPESKLLMSSLRVDNGYGVAKVLQTKVGSYRLESIFTVARTQWFDKNTNSDITKTKCFTENNDSRFVFNDTKTINAVNFKVSPIVDGAGAGNHYSQQAYRIYKNHFCWDITLTNHSSSDWNGVDVNESKNLENTSWSILNQILSTFKFTN